MNAHAPPLHLAPVRTTCPYCGVGCGVLATPDGRGNLDIRGDPKHPANFGRLCSKGSALGETVSLEGRLLHPMLRTRSGAYEQATWEDALDATAKGFERVRAELGPDAIALYLSGQLLTEDYYVANKLMKGFLGSPNVDTNSRLCMASSVAGHRRAFGADVVPASYEDLDQADCIVLVGSNAAWCHPVLFQRIQRNRLERGAKLVVIDPRRTASAEDADIFLPIAPGTDSFLFAGLLVQVAESAAADFDSIERRTSGFEVAIANARQIAPDTASVARLCGIAARDVASFYDLWIATTKVVTAWSQGVNQSAQGVDKVNAIINCHLATGRIGRPGQSPFSLTGQPNAMGGREVGGLANMLAAHMQFEPNSIDKVRRFWRAPNMANREGLKAVAMMEAVSEGRIGALWVMGTNPAASLPRADRVRGALSTLKHFVVSDVVLSNDTIGGGAHILLPAAAWGEKDGSVTNSERCISRQRAALKPPVDARPDWWIVCEVAKRLGFGESFAYAGAAAIFREHAALSAFENGGERAFDIGALATLTDAEYDALQPAQWPIRAGAKQGKARMFSDGAFATPDGKACFVSVAAPALADPARAEFPFLLNSGRVRDHWHTMTRTGVSARLALHRGEPCLSIHPDDATQLKLSEQGLARIVSAHGEARLRVELDAGQRRGEVFAPIHWTAETSSHGRLGAVVQPAVDPISGQPELKATAISIEPVAVGLHGFILSGRPIPLPGGVWWARVSIDGGCGYWLATLGSDASVIARIRSALPHGECADYDDAARSVTRSAVISNGKLAAALFLAPTPRDGAWDAARALFAKDVISDGERRALLSGTSVSGAANDGPMVCACFAVGLGAIRAAVACGAAVDVESIGAHLKAGTNCGSCVPELKRILSGSEFANEPAHSA